MGITGVTQGEMLGGDVMVVKDGGVEGGGERGERFKRREGSCRRFGKMTVPYVHTYCVHSFQ